MEGLYQSCSKNCEIQIMDFWQFFFSFSFTWDHMGVKVSNDISEDTHQIHTPKFMYTGTPGEGLYCSKNCDI